MEYILANRNYIDEMTRMRIAYIKDEQGNIDGNTENLMEKKLPGYFWRHLGEDLFVFAAKENNVFIATAFLLVVEKPSNPHFINGLVGTVLNVYTVPEYRRQGIAKKLMENLVSFAKERKLDFVELNATGEGVELYKKVGFVEYASEYTNMLLRF